MVLRAGNKGLGLPGTIVVATGGSCWRFCCCSCWGGGGGGNGGVRVLVLVLLVLLLLLMLLLKLLLLEVLGTGGFFIGLVGGIFGASAAVGELTRLVLLRLLLLLVDDWVGDDMKLLFTDGGEVKLLLDEAGDKIPFSMEGLVGLS